MTSAQKFAVFGFLDSTAVERGRPVDAHVLNAMARNNNTTLQNREPVLSVAFDAKNDSSMVQGDYPWAQIHLNQGGWQQLTWPMPFGKRPHARTIDVEFIALTDGHLAWVGIGTIADPFIGREDQYVQITTAATAQKYSLSANVSTNSREELRIYWRCEQLTTASSGHGRQTDSIGPGSAFFLSRHLLGWNQHGGAPVDAWDAGPSNASSDTYAGHSIALIDGYGQTLAVRRISNITEYDTNPDYQFLFFDHEVPDDIVQLLNEGGSWEIIGGGVGAIRIYSIAAFEGLAWGT